MEVALRRRLEGVATIAISQAHQTAEVTFAPGRRVFSPEEFRAAVGEAEVEVVEFEIEACGNVISGASSASSASSASGASGAGAAQPERWFVAGANRFVLTGELHGDDTACVSATLDDRREPYELVGSKRLR
jgi:hypothetical protein